MKELVKFSASPKLNSPVMLAAWPGIGNVSIIVATYLKRKLEFEELGEVEASHFFNPIGVLVKDDVVEAPQFPNSSFYYWENKGGGSDIILFIGEDQPTTKSYELANCILDVGLRFQVKRIYTCAAALTRIHHTEPPRVWGVATSQHVAKDLVGYDLVLKGNLRFEWVTIGSSQREGYRRYLFVGRGANVCYPSSEPNGCPGYTQHSDQDARY